MEVTKRQVLCTASVWGGRAVAMDRGTQMLEDFECAR